MIDSDIKGWIVEYPKGRMWKTPSGKFFWTTSGAAKNAFSCHEWAWLPAEYGKLGYYDRKKKVAEIRKSDADFLMVTLKAEKE